MTPDFEIHPKALTDKPFETNVENMYWMFRNVKKSIDLVPSGYDVILRTRFDIKYNNPVKITPDMDMSKIWIPKMGDWRGGIFDMFAFSSPENMKHYASAFNAMDDYIEGGVLPHPETLLGHHLKGKELERFELVLHLFRNHPERGQYLWLATQHH